jgi:hypothetical protein
MTNITLLSHRQLSTVLAALRYYQNDLDGSRLSSDVDPEGALNDIATNSAAHEGLSAFEIDELCERLNFGDRDSLTAIRSHAAQIQTLNDAAPALLISLIWILRCAKTPGPAGTTSYFISDSLMTQARVAVAQATGKG